MWYELLPTVTIITAAITLPSIYSYFSNKFVLNQPYKRVILSSEDAFMFCRDASVSGRSWGYDYKGLDNIPDMENKSSEGINVNKKASC